MLSLDYIAGFFDGEGSVGIYGARTKYLLVQVCQVDNLASRSLLEELAQRWGGSIREQSTPTGRGKLNWQVTGAKALPFLQAIEPHVVLKRQQVQVAVEWQSTRPERQRNERGHTVRTSPEQLDADRQVAARLVALKKV